MQSYVMSNKGLKLGLSLCENELDAGNLKTVLRLCSVPQIWQCVGREIHGQLHNVYCVASLAVSEGRGAAQHVVG
jgi:hypothetical protein